MYDLLVAASERNPIVDNEQGSLVTMSSLQALIFGIINIVGNFGTVFVDNVRFCRIQKKTPSTDMAFIYRLTGKELSLLILNTLSRPISLVVYPGSLFHSRWPRPWV